MGIGRAIGEGRASGVGDRDSGGRTRESGGPGGKWAVRWGVGNCGLLGISKSVYAVMLFILYFFHIFKR